MFAAMFDCNSDGTAFKQLADSFTNPMQFVQDVNIGRVFMKLIYDIIILGDPIEGNKLIEDFQTIVGVLGWNAEQLSENNFKMIDGKVSAKQISYWIERCENYKILVRK
jgi:hypothetical protein